MSRPQKQTCNFCGKDKEQVEKLIVGEGAAICNDCVSLCVDILTKQKKTGETKEFNPTDLKDYLDQYIIGHDDAKIFLSVAVAQHFKRLSINTTDVQIEKSNVLMLGPTGCGKTMMAKKIAEYLDLPFAICDATSLTEAGYVGDDVESILTRLINEADGDIDLAKKGVVYIDEIDKIARRSDTLSNHKDVGGEGVQQSLLKIIEGHQVVVPLSGKKRPTSVENVEIDTSNILFICGGSFSGLEKIINERTNTKTIGFNANFYTGSDLAFKDVTAKDLIKYGFIPEFVGRFGLLVPLDELSLEDLIKILTEPKNNLISQYKEIFKFDGVDLKFDRESIEKIAEKSLELKTNARGLKAILESVLVQYQFDAIDLVKRGLKEILISKDTIESKKAKLIFDKKEL